MTLIAKSTLLPLLSRLSFIVKDLHLGILGVGIRVSKANLATDQFFVNNKKRL